MRCFTVLLACGWLLLAPYTKDGKSWDANQPLSKWKHVGSFDTAKECSEHKSHTLSTVSEEKDKQAYASSRCIPSDALGVLLK